LFHSVQEAVAVYTEEHTEYINKVCGENAQDSFIIEGGGTYGYHYITA
jgi:hypothetical protein